MGYLTLDPKKLLQKVERTIDLVTILNIERKSLRLQEINTLVCTGISGQIVTVPVALSTGLHFCVIRKEDERSHGYPIEKDDLIGNFLIVDDFIEQGETIRRVIDILLGDEAITLDDWKGVLLYRPNKGRGTGVKLWDYGCEEEWTIYPNVPVIRGD